MHEFGAPERVLNLVEYEIPSADTLRESEVLINILAVRTPSYPSKLALRSTRKPQLNYFQHY
jgi:hypothetical protein